jgi:hypothetical protein
MKEMISKLIGREAALDELSTSVVFKISGVPSILLWSVTGFHRKLIIT